MVSLKASIDKFDSELWYYHVIIPAAKVKSFIKENKRVVCTVNKTISIQAALMPNGKGNYFILLNQEVRKKLKLSLGDEVLIELSKDESEYGMPFPQELETLLEQDEEGRLLFQKLTKGKQRTLIYIIAKPKSIDLRIRNAIGVITHLKLTQGKIDYKQLNDTIKSI
ncbi:MAG: YdeI/OmpD-associated family protein [Bacteroidia bacterium]|jgi:hypothetical protein|nr:YdeI/OmpD-associated family protein [Bacteroidia bacterium]